MNLKNRFLLTCSLRENNPEDTINTIRSALYDGAEAFMIHLEKLDDQYINEEDLKNIFNYCGDKPVISVNYRSAHKPDKTDEDLVRQQLIASKAGAYMVDIVGDIFAPGAKEITYDEQAISKQQALIKEFHKQNTLVMLSSHTFCFMDRKETVAHAKSLQSRGPDMIKIAVTANSDEELNEVNITTIELKKELTLPYFHCCMGQYGKLHRIYSALLGSSIVLCVQSYNQNSKPKEQPLLKSTKAVFDNMDFTLARDISTGTKRG